MRHKLIGAYVSRHHGKANSYCGPVQCGRWVPTFWKNTPWKMKAAGSWNGHTDIPNCRQSYATISWVQDYLQNTRSQVHKLATCFPKYENGFKQDSRT